MRRIQIIIYFALFFLSVLYSFTAKAQGRLVMNNNAYLVIENSAKLVVGSPNTNALTTVGTGGNIVSEDEFDQVVWQMGNPGAFVIPFTNEAGVKIPMTLFVSVPGSYEMTRFSTYKGATWDNATYLPTDVTHINNATGSNNSANVIDRFWIIESEFPGNYPIMGTLDFTYDDAEHLAAGNTIVEANLQAQRFNSDLSVWGDYLPSGTANTVTNQVSSASFNGNFYRSWTLVESGSPMPVELMFFEKECSSEEVELRWGTASETNNLFFTVESSENGIVFVPEATVSGAGNSNQQTIYSYRTKANKYYRLTQTDFNGMTEELGTLFANCSENTELVYWQSMDMLNEIKVSGLMEGEIQFLVYDMGGKLLVNEKSTYSSSSGILYLPELSNGMYTISISNGDRIVTGMVMMVK